MSKSCTICQQTKEANIKAKIFLPNGLSQDISLCPTHDMELYKMGQISFLTKHRLTLIKRNDGTPLGNFEIKDVS